MRGYTCQKCGNELYFDGKCFVCIGCGWWDYNWD